jgi:hypothetical protein
MLGKKVVQTTPSFQFYQVRHPRGACYERRSSRIPCQTPTWCILGEKVVQRTPSKFIMSDTHVVHFRREGRPENAFLPNLSCQTPTWCILGEKVVQRTPSFQIYHVEHPRGVFYERRSSRRLLSSLSKFNSTRRITQRQNYKSS